MAGLLGRLVRLLPVVALAAAFGAAAVATAPASHAAGCSGESGVTVVVDFNQLDAGVQSGCVEGGGDALASDLFPAVGFTLDFAQREQGFVCRVGGLPASDPCVNAAPAHAYWGLYWSTGDPGSDWTYSSLGARSLRVPDGGLVAFSWDEVPGDAVPSAPATRGAMTEDPAPGSGAAGGIQPSQQPNPGGGRGGGQQEQGPAGEPGVPPTGEPTSGAPTEEADGESAERRDAKGRKQKNARGDKRERRDRKEAAVPTGAPTTDATTPAPAADVVSTSTVTDASEDGLPEWVAPVVIVVLLASSGVAALVRRRGDVA